MRYLFIIAIVVGQINSLIAQKDKAKIDLNLAFERIDYLTDEIYNVPYYSSGSWNPDFSIYPTNNDRRVVVNKCLNWMLHAGFSIPIIKQQKISFGLRGEFGFGKMKTYKDPTVTMDGIEVQDFSNQVLKINKFSLDASACGYIRMYLTQLFDEELSTSLFGGYRYLNAYDKYGMPVVGTEVTIGPVSVGFSLYLTKVKYYRELSDGTLQNAIITSDYGAISLHYSFNKKPKRSKNYIV